jgi:hypothetical protein
MEFKLGAKENPSILLTLEGYLKRWKLKIKYTPPASSKNLFPLDNLYFFNFK